MMKKMNLILIAVLMIATPLLQAQNFKANPSKTTIIWRGEKVTGKHWGNINLKSGEMTLKNNQIASGTFVIDMTSIVDKDLESEEYNKKLVGHLKSDDFFGVATYPEAKLVITKAGAFKNNQAEVEANVTIKKTTGPVKFTVTKNGNNYTAKIVIDRSKYDVRYGSKSFFDNLGDKVIYDDFTLEVDLAVDAI